jgi:hypothetical protein
MKVTSLADLQGGNTTQKIAVDVISVEELAKKLGGPGLTIKSARILAGDAQFGNFSGGLDTIGLAEGIILSSGYAANIIGTYMCENSVGCAVHQSLF